MFGIPEYEVTHTDDHGDQLNVYASVRLSPKPCCPPDKLVLNGGKVVLIRDVSVGGKLVGVNVRRQRYLCRKCGRTVYQPLPQVSETHNMTARMVERIEKQSATRTFASVADELGISEASVRQIFGEHVDRRLNALEIKTPHRMGLDEVYVGRKCRALITNLSESTIVNLLADRSPSTVGNYFARLPDRADVEIVAMDFWESYREAVHTYLPNARVVVDRFHVMALCIAAVESVRKKVRASTPRSRLFTLVGDRKLLLSNRETLTVTENVALTEMLRNHPTLADAHVTKELFRSILLAGSAEEGAERYDEWKRLIPQCVEGAFSELVQKCDDWKTEFLAYIETGVTNAYTESLNNAVRILTRIGRGYSFEVMRAKLLLSHSMQKQAPRRFVRSLASSPSCPNDSAENRSEILGTDIARLSIGSSPQNWVDEWTSEIREGDRVVSDFQE